MFAEAIKKILTEAEERMRKSVEVPSQELASLRTGRASPAILDGIKVEYYGAPYEIRELATITVPDPRTLVIDPWDKQMLEPIRKAITNSPLSLNPVNDGKVLRIHLPPFWCSAPSVCPVLPLPFGACLRRCPVACPVFAIPLGHPCGCFGWRFYRALPVG